jgi:hypothetical protein
VKDLRVFRTVRDLTLALAIAFSIILAGFGTAAAGGRSAPIEIGFLGVPPLHFQNVLLNVQAVRINPKVNAAPNDSKWQRIGVPAGIGTGGGNSPELQIDLNNSQNIPQLFNTAKVKPDKYQIAQLILDPNNPGTIVPDCPNAGTPEGCINYPIQLSDAGAPINLIPPSQPLVNPGKGALAQLMIQLTVTINTAPTHPGSPYLVTVSMLPVTSLVTGTVSGTNVPGKTGTSAKHLRKLAVIAEPIGTNTQIASSPVKNTDYTLALPAASGPGDSSTFFGTLYDLVLAGGGDSYGAIRLKPLIPGETINPPDFANILTNQNLGSITGTIKDACTNTTIAGATIQLLLPPQNTPATAADCIDKDHFRNCVSVASATTNNAGLFPLPGTITLPSAFEQVPILTGTDRYSMMITAPGYDPTFTIVNASTGKNGGNCNPDPTSKTSMPCNFSLNRGTISGVFQIVAPIPGETMLVEVFAEDAGTNNIVSALPNPITVRSTSGTAIGFNINVPTTPIPPATDRKFDLFATTIDSFQGLSDPYQGHSIAVIKGVTGPVGTCGVVTGAASIDSIDCVGHGSITGTVLNADLGTSVVLSKDDVMITNTPVQNTPPNPASSNAFSFCAPGDTYTVQKLQLPKPDQAATPLFAPTPLPAPPVIDVTIPLAPVVGGPTATPTPSPTPTGGPTPTATPTGGPTPTLKCPTNCSVTPGTCPGICNNVGVTIPEL